MSEFGKALSVTASGLRAQAKRLVHVSENISNADTPGYRRKTVSFQAVRDLATDVSEVRVNKAKLDRSELEQIYDPNHPLADATGHYMGSNVDLMMEIADAREAQRTYDANLKMFDQTRQMSSSLMELLRR